MQGKTGLLPLLTVSAGAWWYVRRAVLPNAPG